MGQHLESLIRRYAEQIVRFRFVVILLSLLLVGLAASGAANLEFSTNYRVFFSQENPELNAFENFQKTFTKNDNIVIVLQPKDGKVFSPKIAGAVEWLTAQSWKVPYAIRVDSISNYQHTYAKGDELVVEDLVRHAEQTTPEKLKQREGIALLEPLLRGNLISPDADTTGVNITIQYPEKSIKEVPEAVAYARGLVKELEKNYPDLKIALSGVSMLNNAFAESGETDAMTLIPIMYLALILMLVFTLRSFGATFVTLLVIGVSTLTAMGLAGHFDIKLTPVSITAPTIILTLAIADSIHILVTMLGLMHEGKDKISALKESLRINFVPVTITSLTTIVGFLSLNFSDSPPFWHLGNITAMGIAAAWLFSLAFMPALLSYLPMHEKKRRGLIEKTRQHMDRLAGFVIAKRKSVLLFTVLMAVVTIAFVPSLSLNDQFVRYFDKRVDFRNDADFATEHLNGVYVIEYPINAAEAGGISSTAYLSALEGFTEWLRNQTEVTHVYSYTDIIKRLNKNMHEDNAAYFRLPENRDLSAQYLLLYELSLPYGLDLNDRINIDKSATRVSVTVKEISTQEIRDFLTRSESWLQNNAPIYMHAKATSASVMFSHISERNIESMLHGNAVAVVIIALILILSLRSTGLGLLSIIPNAVPILMTYGIWTILVGQVGMAAATVTATSLGIVVDDTVHFLTKYLLARREKNYSQAMAVRYAFRMVGPAIVMTTIILVVGFSVLAFSTFMINAQMGLLTAIAILVALMMDFLMLPALLLIGYKPESEQETEIKAIEFKEATQNV